jgi:nicotinamidase-related amidase
MIVAPSGASILWTGPTAGDSDGRARHRRFERYQVTVVKDATASYSDERMHAALDINLPHYASALVTANEVIESIASL